MANKFNFKTITNDEYKNMKKFEIFYGFRDTKFGPCIIGVNKDRLCYLGFYDDGKDNSAIDKLQGDWPNAVLQENKAAIKPFADKIFSSGSATNVELNLLIRGTELQVNVWKALTDVKSGITASYEQIAKAIGNPKAIRAVASAVARNKIAYVIPCHRIIQKSGNIGKYGGGVQRKKDMLEYENAAY